MKKMINVVVCADSKIFRRYWESFYLDNPRFKRGGREVSFRWLDSNEEIPLLSSSLYSMVYALKKKDNIINFIFPAFYQTTNSDNWQTIKDAWEFLKYNPVMTKDVNQVIFSTKSISLKDISTSFARMDLIHGKDIAYLDNFRGL